MLRYKGYDTQNFMIHFRFTKLTSVIADWACLHMTQQLAQLTRAITAKQQNVSSGGCNLLLHKVPAAPPASPATVAALPAQASTQVAPTRHTDDKLHCFVSMVYVKIHGSRVNYIVISFLFCS